jgi:hypothetical protein
MGIFGQIQNAVNSILPQLYSDDQLTTQVTWKKFSGSEFNESAGMNEDTYTESSITAIKVEKEVGSTNAGRAFPPGPWAIATGDVQYLFRHDDVPDGASIRDLIVDGDLTYSVKKIYPVFNLIVKVEVEGYA